MHVVCLCVCTAHSDGNLIGGICLFYHSTMCLSRGLMPMARYWSILERHGRDCRDTLKRCSLIGDRKPAQLERGWRCHAVTRRRCWAVSHLWPHANGEVLHFCWTHSEQVFLQSDIFRKTSTYFSHLNCVCISSKAPKISKNVICDSKQVKAKG